MLPEAMAPQNDFSAGELNIDAKRSDDPLVKTGARQLSNWRILNSRKVVNRDGRVALFPTDGRVDEVLIAPGSIYRLCFGNGTLKIRDSAGNVAANQSGYAWTAATAHQIVWTLVNRSATSRSVVMTFPGQRVKVAVWDSGTWSFFDFAFAANSYGAIQEPFYRLAPLGISLTPSAITGSITVAASAPVFTAGMVGTIIRWLEHQILITAFTDSQHVTGGVIETLPVTINTGTVSAPAGMLPASMGIFNIGDAISTTTAPRTNYEGTVSSITVGGGVVTSMTITMSVTGQQFATSDMLVGPNGTCVAGTVTVVAPGPSVEWDEEVLTANRGWPQSCFTDNGRLGFCDLPAVPGGIVWSGIGAFNNFMVGANPADPMFEIAPDHAHVFHVVSKGDEFFITDQGVYYCPINPNNPLKPGSVTFLKFSADKGSSVKPVQTSQSILYVNAGLNRIIAIIVNTHSLYVPWAVQEVSLYHSHLIKSPIALAVSNDGEYLPEQYVYALNNDGTIAVGKFDVAKEWAGWLPWTGAGFVNWISSLGQAPVFTTTYTSNSVPVTIAEQLGAVPFSIYVDGAVFLNNVAANMQSAGLGPLWWLANGTVDLIDGLLPLGTYSVDGTGNVIKNDPSEDLSSATIIAGLAWQAVLEPFFPHVQGGQDEGQRVKKRKIRRIAVTVLESTGFVMSAIAPISCFRRIPTWNVGDDQGQPPPWHETTYSFRTRGRDYDPRVMLIKDTPGPITVIEWGTEATV